MTYSYNEIETTMRKAALGLGWPGGIAERFGLAAAYLERHGVSGIEPILSLLEKGPVAAKPEYGSGTACFNDAGGLAFIAGLDLLAARSVRRIEFGESENFDALIGLAGAAASEYSLGISLESGGEVFASVFERRLMLREGGTESGGAVAAALLPRSECRIAVAERKELDPAAWSKAQALAALTLVPSTDASRLLGAGAGLHDND